MLGKTIDEIKVGESAEFAKTISESDIYLFAGITGDLNPFHVNEAKPNTKPAHRVLKFFGPIRYNPSPVMLGFIAFNPTYGDW